MAQHVGGLDFVEADVAGYAAAINAGMKRAHAFLDDALAVVPWGKPIGLAGAEDGDNRLAESRGKMGGKGVVTEDGVASSQCRNQRRNGGRGECSAGVAPAGLIFDRRRDACATRRDFYDLEFGMQGVHREEFAPFFHWPLFRRQSGVAVNAEDWLGIFLCWWCGNPGNGKITFESQGARHLAPAQDVRATLPRFERMRKPRKEDFD